tara:strand:+ start:1724 stop:2818 length:1095 start_codon:yes stop_codon:yes gene_type:complete
MSNSKINKLQNLLIKEDVDALALVPGSNFLYLTGGNFHLMERPTILIISKDKKPIAILPVLEIDSFKKLKLDADIFEWQDSDGYQAAFSNAFKKLGLVKKIGIEGQRMRVFESQAIEKASPGIEIINAHKFINHIRIKKDESEIIYLQKAVDIAEKTLNETIKYVDVNKTEMEIKNFLIQQLYRFGAEGIAFDPIVLGGGNSALPHGHSSDYKIKEGDCLLFDFGATVHGYHSDITRTFFVKSASDDQKNFYETVLKANKIGLEISKPGLSLHELDNAVLNTLENSEFSEFIVHKTGHGLGLDVHEDPYVMRKNHDLLESGMVITIEPGLYKKNSLGVRIEDDVVITNDGCKSLTTFTKELTII